jgi:hypothetical protein
MLCPSAVPLPVRAPAPVFDGLTRGGITFTRTALPAEGSEKKFLLKRRRKKRKQKVAFFFFVRGRAMITAGAQGTSIRNFLFSFFLFSFFSLQMRARAKNRGVTE